MLLLSLLCFLLLVAAWGLVVFLVLVLLGALLAAGCRASLFSVFLMMLQASVFCCRYGHVLLLAVAAGRVLLSTLLHGPICAWRFCRCCGVLFLLLLQSMLFVFCCCCGAHFLVAAVVATDALTHSLTHSLAPPFVVAAAGRVLDFAVAGVHLFACRRGPRSLTHSLAFWPQLSLGGEAFVVAFAVVGGGRDIKNMYRVSPRRREETGPIPGADGPHS